MSGTCSLCASHVSLEFHETNTLQLTGTDGGNPGSQRRMTHLLPGTDDGDNNPTQITVVHVFTGGGWDPTIDGALTSDGPRGHIVTG